MTSEQIDIVRSTFAQIFFNKEEVGRLFYRRLFAIAPETRPLFKGDVDAQGRKLIDTLGVAVSALRDMPRLKATLRDLGRRHRDYGVQPEHYEIVGKALLDTLEKSLGTAFDETARQAWTTLYGAVAGTMISESSTAVPA